MGERACPERSRRGKLGLLLALGLSLLLPWGCGQPTPTLSPPSPSPLAMESPSPIPPSPTATLIPPSPTPSALQRPSPSPPSASPTSTPELKPLAYLEPASQEGRPGQEVLVKVMVRPGGRGVSAAEVSLAFPPGVFQALALEPGDLLGRAPLVGLEELDNVGGRVRYALARLGPTAGLTPEGTLASIRLKVLDGAAAGDYPLDLEVGLADENFQRITDIPLRGGSIRVR